VKPAFHRIQILRDSVVQVFAVFLVMSLLMPAAGDTFIHSSALGLRESSASSCYLFKNQALASRSGFTKTENFQSASSLCLFSVITSPVRALMDANIMPAQGANSHALLGALTVVSLVAYFMVKNFYQSRRMLSSFQKFAWKAVSFTLLAGVFSIGSFLIGILPLHYTPMETARSSTSMISTKERDDWLAPRPGEDEFRHDRRLLSESILRAGKYKRILSQLQLPSSFKIDADQIEKAVPDMLQLINDPESPLGYLSPESPTWFSVERSNIGRQIKVNGDKLLLVVTKDRSVMLHEIAHLTPPHQKLSDRVIALEPVLAKRLIPYLDRSKLAVIRANLKKSKGTLSDDDAVFMGLWDANVLQKQPDLKKLVIEYLRCKAASEFEAWYITIAAITIGDEETPNLQTLAQLIEPYAQKDGKTVAQFVETVLTYGTNDATAMVLAAEYRMTQGFQMGRLSYNFTHLFIDFPLLNGNRMDIFVNALARVDLDPNFNSYFINGSVRREKEYIDRFEAWASRTFIPEIEDYREPAFPTKPVNRNIPHAA
jgi:hypothetical protein